MVALPHDIDPYIPVALADVCIGVPFTSPVIAGMESGRGGIFHDPFAEISHVPAAPALIAHVTQGATGLHERLALLSERDMAIKRRDPGTDFVAALIA